MRGRARDLTARARERIRAARLVVHATSLGSVETLVSHPASSSHRQLTDAELAPAGLTAGTVRVEAAAVRRLLEPKGTP